MTTQTPKKMTGDEYMDELLARQAAWMGAHPHVKGMPLLEWFVRDGDENLVDLPAAAPSPTRMPRTYATAKSLRDRRDELQTTLDAMTFHDGPPDRAAANITTPGRWKSLDSQIAKGAKLAARIDKLNHRIAAAEQRERNAILKDVS